MMSYDVAVVGLGAVGSAAVRSCTARGMHVLGLDRHRPPHTLGSSHGGSRIIRRAYFEGAIYVPLLNHAYALWKQLERETGERIYHRSGVLVVAASDSEVLSGAEAAAEAYEIPVERLAPADVHARFPAMRMQDGEAALWEPDAGWLHPERAVEVQLQAARGAGADLRLDEPVRRWEKNGSGFEVHTDRGTYRAGSLVLCSGGWLSDLLPDLELPLTIERQVNVWYTPRSNPEHFQPDRCPAYIWEYEAGRVLYGFPDLGGGVKAGLHHHGRPAAHPDALPRVVSPEDVRDLTATLTRLMPDACGAASRTAVCFYTNTPDEQYLVDRHPEHAGVAIASACSGHGFKASIAVGDVLAAMTAGEPSPVDASPFALRWRRNRGGAGA